MTLPSHVSSRQRTELNAFARYCVNRLERELGPNTYDWTVSLAPGPSGVAAIARVRIGTRWLTSRGDSREATLAIWNALSRLEQPLRDSAAVRIQPAA